MFFFISYQSHSNLRFVAVDSWPAMSGISFMLINVRVGPGWAQSGSNHNFSSSTPPNPLTDPAAMDGMMAGMKTQMVMMVPQMVIMGWINFFFQGFVLSKSVLTSRFSRLCFRAFPVSRRGRMHISVPSSSHSFRRRLANGTSLTIPFLSV